MYSIKIYTYGNIIEINQAPEELCNKLIEWFKGIIIGQSLWLP